MFCGMGPPGERWGQYGGAIMGVLITDLEANLLITCRFLVIFLVVSRKKRNFGGKLYKLNNRR